MSLDTTPVPQLSDQPLSGQQRRCHMVLMLFMPAHKVQLEAISQFNGVGLATTRQDITEVANEIQRFYHLQLNADSDNSCLIQGSHLDKRLCLIHWLRRGLRYCPHFVENQFAPHLYQALSWDNTVLSQHLPQIVSQCEPHLSRQLNEKDRQFLQLYLAYCAWENQQQVLPELSLTQQQWLECKPALAAADSLFDSFNPLLGHSLNRVERDMLILMLTMIKAHSYHSTQSAEDTRLINAIDQLITHFQQLSGMTLSSNEALISQLFAHLAPAIERCYFNIGIDNSLLEDVIRKYPLLLQTTRQALVTFEQEYQIQFSADEVGLIAISFGAWLMQENALQEKQILLLTRNNPELEEQVEQQVRELTLLPLHIKYLPHDVYLQSGAPTGTTLVLTPYAVRQPESTPPLIQVQLPLTEQQNKQLRSVLELP
ncbi:MULTISPECIES: stationary phase inducible protein CsiE [Yersinia]|jgi:transcriptional antiterminator|uniref:Stationary phase inducible protein CsiE n=1 Tax=Yersinia intermedia TaxID=631 RepID=A0A0T9M8F7_YERIN|nr:MULTISPECIES: stationary phase inducible protein CsiE [Yersinia]ARB84152.1 stationary phase inducible protein CsiE [Yersinia sp. FDAARGOS_228]AVL37947.1 stationary phase inducible protein CsiE [Yersinia intermedia]MCB5298018.1 stationary phase inducible protein CsiE [Yersinia intermedia]MCW8111022.1 stationary phase inducible protein CsiE [Yersinia intermedia]MDA5493781.1 stationary phase inducible protein CsiE [Yersinia intermedia]